MSELRRIVIVYDDQVCPHTTGIYCLRALSRLADVRHVRPEEIGALRAGQADLFINIDDGLRYRWPVELRPSAWWAIDTHLDWPWYLAKGVDFDLLFAAQLDGSESLRQAGFSAQWLPLACDPEIHRMQGEEQRTIDVAFVGHMRPGPRQELVRLLQDRYANSFVGERYFADMASIYSKTKIAFNRSVVNDVNMRVFEAPACGPLLITNDLAENGLNDLLTPDRDIVTYRFSEELIDKVAFYLSHDATRKRIAQQGRATVLLRHTYENRMRTLLQHVEQHFAKTSSRVSLGAGTQSKCPPSASPELDGEGNSQTAPRFRPYYEFSRPEVLALVPLTAQHVLDVGCGAGRLGESIRARQSAFVTGIEANAAAARVATQHLNRVLNEDAEGPQVEFREGEFDCIICADVLEHMEAPLRFLQRALRWLNPDGRLIASIPNCRHHSVIASLVEGNWTYEPAGLLDATHLHFFTRMEIEQLLDRAGFDITRLEGKCCGEQFGQAESSQGRLRVGRLELRGLPDWEIEELDVYQWLIEAQPRALMTYGLTSIVILTLNQLSYTRQCLTSIEQFTDEPIEVIVVDNGSTDGTVEFLETQPNVRIIENQVNQGFAGGVNQGIAAAQGDQIVLLNNDVVVTSGWLRKLLKAICTDPQVGLAGPCTSWPDSCQQIKLGYRDDLIDLELRAWEWGHHRNGNCGTVDELLGFCLAFRRDVAHRLGPFDEQFGLGMCEDKDYSRRSLAAGYWNILVQDAYVHHFGHRTFAGNRIDSNTIYHTNRKRFHEKWQTPGWSPTNDAVSQQNDKTQPPPPKQRSFRHSGDLGDIIFGLATVRALGGGSFFVDAERDLPWKDRLGRERAQQMVELLATQDCVCHAALYEGQQVDHDFDAFRSQTGTVYRQHLAVTHAEAVGLSIEALNLSEPWMFLIGNKVAPIVVCRSGRRHGQLEWAALAPYRDQCVFLGHPEEHDDFVKKTGLAIAHHPVDTLREYAEIVAGASLVVSNATFGIALAEALKVPRVLEVFQRTPNCLPQSSSGHTALTGDLLETYVGTPTRPSTTRRNPSPRQRLIGVGFDHGLGDCANFAHMIPLYQRRGYELAIDCPQDKRVLFEIAGATIVTNSGAAAHPWVHGACGALSEDRPWAFNKLASNLSLPPLPDIGSPDALWDEYCRVRLNPSPHISEQAARQAAAWIECLPRPVTLIHTSGIAPNGLNNIAPASLPAIYDAMLEVTSGSLVLLDWLDRMPRCDSSRVRHLLDDFRSCNVEQLLALMQAADLLVGIDAGPLHAALFTSTPVLGLWTAHHPALFTLPRARTLNLVLTDRVSHSPKIGEIPFSIMSHAGLHWDARQIAKVAARMLEGPRLLAADNLAADIQLENYLATVESTSWTCPSKQMSKTFLQEIRSRFQDVSILDCSEGDTPDDLRAARHRSLIWGFHCRSGGHFRVLVSDHQHAAELSAATRMLGACLQVDVLDALPARHPQIDVLSWAFGAGGLQNHQGFRTACSLLHERSLILFWDSRDSSSDAPSRPLCDWLASDGWRRARHDTCEIWSRGGWQGPPIAEVLVTSAAL